MTPGVKPTADADSYIRGAGGVRVEGRRVVDYLFAVWMLILAALVVVFLLIAMHDNSRTTSLKHKGVPVQVTVTGCVAIASGTGITEAGFKCKGSYEIGGRRYDESIGGNADLLGVGQKLAGVAVRDEPTVLYTASSVQKMHSTWTAYLTPGVLLVVLIGSEVLRRRLAGRRST